MFCYLRFGIEPVVAYKDPFIGFDANIPHFERAGRVW